MIQDTFKLLLPVREIIDKNTTTHTLATAWGCVRTSRAPVKIERDELLLLTCSGYCAAKNNRSANKNHIDS